MNEAILNFITSMIGIIVLVWTIYNVVNKFEQEAIKNDTKKRK